MEHYTKDNFLAAQSIGFSINKARNIMAAEMDNAMKDLAITSQQMGILLSIDREIASTPFELSKLLGIDTGLMTRLLDKLERKGLLDRSRSMEDLRVVNLTLTENGKEVAKQIPEIAPAVLNGRLKCFTKQEFNELDRCLTNFLVIERHFFIHLSDRSENEGAVN
ncbi:MarR family transcriptional regulator [Paraburkholderia panacisoli]|uniref:MarR family transcriptional regulator n=1 Tax=Paraburkholderia panacisoli TaxID=2603818 RepID=A0A5B0GQ74_9BURK|nr:MarR family transcriptional regulator [Paraburkholderia panacisoli]KAA1004938.1 MarR family transcriptional regulator [Paraburkholderia panacisoli]